VQHQSIGLIETDFHRPETLRFARFDPGAGTLTSVLISCETRMIVAGSMKNHSADSQHFSLTVAVEMSLAAPRVLRAAALRTAPTVAATFSILGGATVNIPWNAGIDQRTVLLATPAELAAFAGKGHWEIQASTVTSHALQGGGGEIESAITAKAALDVMVQYEFLPAVRRARAGGFKPAQVRPLGGKRSRNVRR
jgi:hypothetical protein